MAARLAILTVGILLVATGARAQSAGGALRAILFRGEAGTTGDVPTLANAVLDALRPLGIERLDFPYTPARVWGAIQAAKRKS